MIFSQKLTRQIAPWITRYVSLLTVAAIVGCGAFPVALEDAGEARPAVSLTQLNDAQIRNTVEGRYLEIDHGLEGVAPQRERFCEGVYTTRGDVPPFVHRPYSISGGRLCVGEGSVDCRTLHLDESGQLYMRYLRERGVDTWRSVAVGPLPDCSN